MIVIFNFCIFRVLTPSPCQILFDKFLARETLFKILYFCIKNRLCQNYPGFQWRNFVSTDRWARSVLLSVQGLCVPWQHDSLQLPRKMIAERRIWKLFKMIMVPLYSNLSFFGITSTCFTFSFVRSRLRILKLVRQLSFRGFKRTCKF